jgi:hypothetical protein
MSLILPPIMAVQIHHSLFGFYMQQKEICGASKTSANIFIEMTTHCGLTTVLPTQMVKFEF